MSAHDWSEHRGQGVLRELQAQFDPTRPLPAGDPRYVRWAERLGLSDSVEEARRHISRARVPGVVLVTGQRGTGKSSDLNRLKRELEGLEPGERVFVVSTTAVEAVGDLAEINGAMLTLHMVRCLVRGLVDRGYDYQSHFERFTGKVKERLGGITVDWDLKLGLGISLAYRDAPSDRAAILRAIEAEVPTLHQVVNEDILPQATTRLRNDGWAGIALVVDDLDHVDDAGDDAARRFFLRDSAILRSLACSVVYTVPVGLAFGPHQQKLRDLYGSTLEVGYVPVHTRKGEPDQEAIAAIAEIVEHRVAEAGSTVVEVFGSADWVGRLAGFSGGNLRALLRVVTTAVSLSDSLPLDRVMATSLRRDADSMARFLDDPSRELIGQVAETKSRPGDPAVLETWAKLVGAGCILAYRDVDQSTWYDRHPLLGNFEVELS